MLQSYLCSAFQYTFVYILIFAQPFIYKLLQVSDRWIWDSGDEIHFISIEVLVDSLHEVKCTAMLDRYVVESKETTFQRIILLVFKLIVVIRDRVNRQLLVNYRF